MTKALATNTSRTGVVGGKGSPIADDQKAKVSTGESILNAGATKALNSMLKKTGMTIDEFNEKHAPKGAETKMVNGVLHAAAGDLVDKEKIPVPQPVTQSLQTKALANPLNQPTLNSSAMGLTPNSAMEKASTDRNVLNSQATAFNNPESTAIVGGSNSSALANNVIAPIAKGSVSLMNGIGNLSVPSSADIGYKSGQAILKTPEVVFDGAKNAIANSPIGLMSQATGKALDSSLVKNFVAGVTGDQKIPETTPSLAVTPTAPAKTAVATDGNMAVTGLNPAPKFEQVSPVVTPNNNPMADNQVAMKGEQIQNNDGTYVVKQKTADGRTSYSDSGIEQPTRSLAGKSTAQPEVAQPMTIGGQPVNNMGVPTGQSNVSTGVDSRYGAGGMNASVANTQSLVGGSTPQERAAIQQRELSQPLPAAPIDQKQVIINSLLRQSQVHDGTLGGASRRNEAMKQLAVLTGIGQDDRKLAMADDESAYKKKRDLVGDNVASQAAIAAAGKSQRDYLLEAMKVKNTLDAPIDFKSINESGEQRTRTMTKAQLAQQTTDYDGYKAAMQKHEGNPEIQKQITDRARTNGLI